MGRAVVQAAVWPVVVVFIAPRFDLPACFPEIAEPVRVQAFIAEAAVETFSECILNRLAWLDVSEIGGCS